MTVFSRLPAIPLVLANLAGIALVAGLPVLAGIAVSIWLADFARRMIRQRALFAEPTP
jgi:hypothetical protein